MHRNFACALVLLIACGDGGPEIGSDEEARRAYLGLDNSIETSLALGFKGFNEASSANIDPQVAAGLGGGSLTVTGQVDQGNSDNKGMRLRVGMVAYTEGEIVVQVEGEDEVTLSLTYDTDADVATQPFLNLSLKNIPTGTLTGTLTGTYHMSGDLADDVTLNLTFAGELMDDGTGKAVRKPGTTNVTGTAVAGDGTFDVALTL